MIPAGEGRRALDLGCGPGRFSSILAARGWRVTAVDTDSQNVAQAAQYGDARLGDAITVLKTLDSGAYGLVLALELIEHMPVSHAMELLQDVARVLGPKGEVIVSTPNRHSPEGLGGYYWGERVRGWGKWNAWDPTHVHIYTSGEAIGLVRRCFDVRNVTGYWYEGYRVKLPLLSSDSFPMNRLGFNVLIRGVRA